MQTRKRRFWGILHFIILWIGAVILAFLLLCGGLQYAVSRQHTKTQLIFLGSQSLQINRAFEAAIVAEGRQDLLRRTTGRPVDGIFRSDLLNNADTLLTQLNARADSADEANLLKTIDTLYAAFRAQFVQNSPHDSAATQRALDELLTALSRHRVMNQQQMDDTMQDANRIDRIVDRVSTTLIIAAMLLVLTGGYELWKRIFKPTLLLSEAAREFGDDLKTRAPVLRNDEMGALAQTFNSMASSIAEREKERLHFVATVAHDLRNPLVVIGGAAVLLKGKDSRLTQEERERWLGNIQKNARKLETLIDDLMDGVQAETGELHFNMERLDLSKVVCEVTDEYAETIETHLIRHEVAPDCVISGDRKRLERVLMNLLSNAAKYSANGKEITVTLEKAEQNALLKVCDEGAGIAAEDIPKLFLPFSRLENTKKMASGTGLGLSSVKKIVEGHSGTICIESEIGVGTTVEITLPLEEALSN